MQISPTDDWHEMLIDLACDVSQRAYAKYSNFHVGAALLTTSQQVFVGCNVENSSYGLTICAERSAICQAVAAGEREFQAIAIATPGAGMPCGACRQVAAEFNPKLKVLLVDLNQRDSVKEFSLAELFPHSFSLPTD